MARKPKHEEHENHERWLVSYADFITLLFAFFVVMYSVSSVNEGKFRVLSDALEAAFRDNPKSMSPVELGKVIRPAVIHSRAMSHSASAPEAMRIPVALPLNAPPNPRNTAAGSEHSKEGEAEKAMKDIADQVEKAMAELIDKDLITVRRFQFWLEIEIKTNILFPSGSAEFSPAAAPVLKEITSILGKHQNPIHVEGFTDNVPIKTKLYPSNWELSTARAMSVVNFFIHSGMKPERLAAVGYGQFKPVASNDTEAGRAKNRKVVLVVMADENAGRMHDSQMVNDPARAEDKPLAHDAATPVSQVVKHEASRVPLAILPGESGSGSGSGAMSVTVP
jgi:chemotaxis protein MotB